MGEDSDFFAGFEGIEKFDFGPPIKAEELFADVFFPQLLADFSELVHKLVKRSRQSTRNKISKLLKQVTKARHVDKLLVSYILNFHRNADGARIVGLSVKDKKFISFLLLRALVVCVENVRELYEWREVFISGNPELYKEVKQATPGLVDWDWLREIFYELDAKDKQTLFDLIDNRPATLLWFIMDKFGIADAETAFAVAPIDGKGLAIPKDYIQTYVGYYESIDMTNYQLRKEYDQHKSQLLQSKLQSFKQDVKQLGLIACFRYVLIAHNPEVGGEKPNYLTPVYPSTSGMMYLTVLFGLFELAAEQFPYYNREGKLPELEEYWLVNKMFDKQEYASNARAYCTLALRHGVPAAEKVMMAFANLHIMGKSFGGDPISISETVRIGNFLKNMTRDQFEAHVFDTKSSTPYEWQKAIWKIGTKFGLNNSAFTLVYIEDGRLFIEYAKTPGIIFKTTVGYILDQQWSELFERLRVATAFIIWYYDFLFNYLIGFTITLVTGGFAALAREVIEEVALEIVDRVTDAPTSLGIQAAMIFRPNQASRGLPVGDVGQALDRVPKFDGGIADNVRLTNRADDIVSPPTKLMGDTGIPGARAVPEIDLPIVNPPVRADRAAQTEVFPVADAPLRQMDDVSVPKQPTPDVDMPASGTTESRSVRGLGDDAPPARPEAPDATPDASPITRAERGLTEEIPDAIPAAPHQSLRLEEITYANLSQKSEAFISANPGIEVMVVRYTDVMHLSPSDANWLRFNIEWAQSNGVPMRVSPDKPLQGAMPRHPKDAADRALARRDMDQRGLQRTGRQAMHPVDGIINPFVDSSTATGTTYYFGNQSVNSSFGAQTSAGIKRLGLKANDPVLIRFEGFPDYITHRPIAPPASTYDLQQ